MAAYVMYWEALDWGVLLTEYTVILMTKFIMHQYGTIHYLPPSLPYTWDLLHIGSDDLEYSLGFFPKLSEIHFNKVRSLKELLKLEFVIHLQLWKDLNVWLSDDVIIISSCC